MLCLVELDDALKGQPYLHPLEEQGEHCEVEHVEWQLVVEVELDGVVSHSVVVVDEQTVEHAQIPVEQAADD